MSGLCYSVSCLVDPKVDGVYVASGAQDTFKQQNGIHVLKRHDTGQWGIGDGKVYLFLTRPATSVAKAPNEPLSWQMLSKGVYIFCPNIVITASGATEPKSATAAGTGAVPGETSDAYMLAPKYSVLECPYKDAGGEYVQEGPHSYVHSKNDAYRLYREGKNLWVLSMNGRVCCRVQSASEAPPPNGWFYWRSTPGAYSPSVKMEVHPLPPPPPPFPFPRPKPRPVPPNEERAPMSPFPPVADPASSAASAEPENAQNGGHGQLSSPDLSSECTKLLDEVALAPARRSLIQRWVALLARYDSADAAEDFKALAAAGLQLEALQRESAQLSLSEEDYLTLPGRHADLVQRVTEKCKELTKAKEYAVVTALGAKLVELRAAALPAVTGLIGAKRTTSIFASDPGTIRKTMSERDKSSDRQLPLSWASLRKQIECAPARREITQQIRAVQAQCEAAEAAAEDFVLIGTLGTKLQALQQQSAKLPLSEEDYLALGDRHASLLLQVTAKCRDLTNARDYAALDTMATHLRDLKTLDVSELPRACVGDPVLPAVSALALFEENEGALDPVLPSAAAEFSVSCEDDSALDPVLPPPAPLIRK